MPAGTAGVRRGAPTASGSPTSRATRRSSTPTRSTSSPSSRRPAARAKVLTEALDRPVSGHIWWSADGKTLTFAVDDDRVEYVGRTTTAGGAVEKLTDRPRDGVERRHSARTAALTLLAVRRTQTPEVHALENGALRKLTKENDDLLAQLQLAHDRGLHVEEQGRHGGERPDREARVVRAGQEVPDAAHHPRRPERAGRPLVQLRPRVLRGERLRGAARSTTAAARAAAPPSRRPSTPTGATRRSSTCWAPWTRPSRRASPTPTASASAAGATAAS